ncbi:MAG: SRPBCC family protein [Mycobacterium sp.]
MACNYRAGMLDATLIEGNSPVNESAEHTEPDVAELYLRRQTWVSTTPESVYALVSDVSAMGPLSPDVVWARFDDGDGPFVGSWFTGHNRGSKGEWETRCKITTAVPGVMFGWAVIVDAAIIGHWTYELAAQDEGTLVTETWQVHNWIPVLGASQDELLELRSHTARSMERTLAALATSFTATSFTAAPTER